MYPKQNMVMEGAMKLFGMISLLVLMGVGCGGYDCDGLSAEEQAILETAAPSQQADVCAQMLFAKDTARFAAQGAPSVTGANQDNNASVIVTVTLK